MNKDFILIAYGFVLGLVSVFAYKKITYVRYIRKCQVYDHPDECLKNLDIISDSPMTIIYDGKIM